MWRLRENVREKEIQRKRGEGSRETVREGGIEEGDKERDLVWGHEKLPSEKK